MTSDVSSDISKYRDAILHPHQCILTCYIPPSRVGAVIGRKGSTILQIQKEASKKGWGPVRLSVLSNLLESTPVLIRGDPCGAFLAAKLLIPLLRDAISSATEGLDSCLEMDDVVLDVPIHRSKHSLIIGKRGSTISHLSAENNVRIMVPHRSVDKSSVANINIIQLEGELGNVEKCLVNMLQLICPIRSSINKPGADDLEQEQEAKVISLGPTKNSISIKDTTNKESKFCEKTIMVPPELFSSVPSIKRIRTIEQLTNTVISRKKISQDKGGSTEIPESDEPSEDETEEKNEASSEKDKNGSIPLAIHFIISGKRRAVDNATSELQKILFNPRTSELDDEKRHVTTKELERGKSGAIGNPRKSKGKGRYGRGLSKGNKINKIISS